jgi:RHS repeat-associated protein
MELLARGRKLTRRIAKRQLRLLISFAVAVTACIGPISLIGARIAGATTPTSPMSVAGADNVPDENTDAVGNFPVDPESGDFWHKFTDISVNGYGPGLDLVRTYNSVNANTSGMFGYGWTAYSSFSPSTDILTMPDGSTIPVTYASGLYSLPTYDATNSSFAAIGSGYKFVFQGSLTYNYNSSGALTSMVDANGATTGFSYTGTELTTITDAAGRTITFTYNPSGTVATATGPSPLNRETTYSYTAYGSGYDLASVTDPMSRVTSFAYYPSTGNDPNAMETMTLPNGQIGGPDAGDSVTNDYNANDEVVAQYDQMNYETQYTYSGTNGSSSGGSTTVLDPDGNTTVYNYNSGTLTSKVIGSSTWAYTYSTPTLGVYQTTDPNGNVTTETYDNYGNEITDENGLGKTWSYSYNSFDEQTCAAEPLATVPCSSLTPPAAIATGASPVAPPTSAPPAFVTYKEYDTDGNLIYSTTGDYAPGSGSASQSRTTYDLYNGQSVTLGTATDSCATTAPSTELPCATVNADGITTQLTYDTYGDLTSKSTPWENSASTSGTMFTFAGGATGPLPATTVFQAPDELASATVGSVGYIYVADPHNDVVRSINGATDSESVVAGDYATGALSDGSSAASAQLTGPSGIAVDTSGDMAIADTNANEVGFVPEVSGTYFGQSMTGGDAYVVAGNGTAGVTGNGALATSAELSGPVAVAMDGGGIVIADTGNNEVRFVPATTGTYFGQSMVADDIYDIAGNGGVGLSGNGGPATSAKLNGPNGVAVDGNDNVAISDHGNNEVRFVAATSGTYYGQSMTAGDIYDLAGNGTSGYSGNGGAATSAELSSASGVAFDSSGDLVIADTNNHVVRFVPKNSGTHFGQSMTANDIYVVAGNGTSGLSGNGGVGTSAELGTPVGVAVDSTGDIYIGDVGNDQIRVVADASGTLAGQSVTADDIYLAGGNSAGSSSESSYSGAATNAELNSPSSVRIDAAGDVFVADAADQAVRFIPQVSGTYFGQAMSAANIYTIAGDGIAGNSGNSGPATSAELSSPQGVGVSSTGNLAIADTANNVVRFVPIVSGTYFGQAMTADDIYTIAGNGTSGYAGNGAAATSAELSSPREVSFDAAGDLLIADSSNHVVRFVPVASGTHYGQSMTANDIYTIAGNHTSGYSGNGGLATSAELSSPADATADSAGDLLIPDTQNNVVRFIPVNSGTYYGQSMTADDIYTIAGNGTSGNSPSGTAATSAEFNTVTDAAFDGGGDVLIADAGNDYLRFLAKSAGEFYGQLMTANYVYIIAGEGTSSGVHYGGDHDPPLDAEFGSLASVAYDGASGFYLADSTDQRIRHDNFNATYYLATTTYTYDVDGEMLSETTPNGNLVTGANAGNHTTVYTYDADGEVTEADQGGGSGYTDVPRLTYYGYDADGNVISKKDPMGDTYTYTFNADDEETLSTNPLGDATLTCYDGGGNVTETVLPSGVTASSLSPASCPTVYPAGYGDRLANDATTTQYSALNEPTVITTPAPPGLTGYETTTKAYDAGGRLISVTEPPTSTSLGAPNDVTTYTYDDANELLTTTTGSGTTTASTSSTCYDPDGNVSATVPGDGNVSSVAICSTSSPYETSSAYQTGYSRDSLGEVVTRTAPATSAAPSGEVTTFVFDPAGNTTSIVSPDGVTTSKTYTPLNLVATVTYSNATPGITYTYDADGNEVGMTDASGTTTSGFDPFDEQTSTTNGAGFTTTRAYNLDAIVDRITYPLASGHTWSSHTVAYQFDTAEDLTVVTDFNGSNSHIAYSADGLPTTLHLGTGGAVVTTTYAANDEPSTITVGSSTQEFAYSDEPSGGIMSETDTPSSSLSPADYVYDSQSRVIKDTPGSGTAKIYAEDASGNLTTMPSGASGSYNYASELTSGGSTNFTYDASGNRLSESGGTTVSATYNGANELTSYHDPAANMTSATYNGNGLRTSTTIGGSTQSFVWDAVSSTPELLQDSTNAYIYGAFGTPFEELNLSTGTAQFLVADALGSVRGVVSSTGTLTASTAYDAWGNPETTGGLSAYTPFGFAGGYTDSTGLVYLINRYYDPTTGAFFTIDPDVGQTGQSYEYGADNPVNSVDPSGLKFAAAGGTTDAEQAAIAPIEESDDDNSVNTLEPTPTPTPTPTTGISLSPPSLTKQAGPVPIDLGLGAYTTVSASVTIVGPEETATVKIDGDGNVNVTIDGIPTTFSVDGAEAALGSTDRVGVQMSYSDGGISATTTQTLYSSLYTSITASITVTVHPSEPTSPNGYSVPGVNLGPAVAGGSTVAGAYVVWRVISWLGGTLAESGG